MQSATRSVPAQSCTRCVEATQLVTDRCSVLTDKMMLSQTAFLQVPHMQESIACWVVQAAHQIADAASCNAYNDNYASPYTVEAVRQGMDLPWWQKLAGARLKDGKLQLAQLTVSGSNHLHASSLFQSLRLPLGIEAPIMMPNGVIFLFFAHYSSPLTCLQLCLSSPL